MKHYELGVIGAGSAGLYIAIAAHKLGLKVLLLCKTAPEVGGECLNTGCIPSKALIYVSKLAQAHQEATAFGYSSSGSTDWQAVKAYIAQKQQVIRSHESVEYLQHMGIDVQLGEAHFGGRQKVEVQGEQFTAKNWVIATGSAPKRLTERDYPELADIVLPQFTHEELFSLPELPKRLLVVGAGPIGTEMAQALHRLGVHVTVVSRERLLQHDPKELTTPLTELLQKEGIIFHLKHKIIRFRSANEVELESLENGRQQLVHFDAVLAAIGRTLDYSTLQLDSAQVKLRQGKIQHNAFLQTTNENIFVAGDAAGGLYFSHAAELHGSIILQNLFSPVKKKLNYDTFSWVTFCSPELATWGLNEQQLRERKVSYRRVFYDFTATDRAVTDNYPKGLLVLYLSHTRLPYLNSKVLGGSMLAPNAGELAQEWIGLNQQGATTSKIFNKLYPYPVSSRVNKEVLTELFLEQIKDKSFIKKALSWVY